MPVNEIYRVQVDLLIRCLPAVAKVRAFALKVGTKPDWSLMPFDHIQELPEIHTNHQPAARDSMA